MTLATGTASAFTASGGGTITVTGGSNNIAASGATALDLMVGASGQARGLRQ